MGNAGRANFRALMWRRSRVDQEFAKPSAGLDSCHAPIEAGCGGWMDGGVGILRGAEDGSCG